MNREEITTRLAFRRAALEQARAGYIALISGGASSYTIGSRSMTKFNLPELKKTITELENEVDELEGMLRNGKTRKAVGVVPRDF